MHITPRSILGAALAATALLTLASTVEARQQSYQIGQGDVLKVAVWSQPELSGEFTVDATGAITMPLIGAVKATGQTVEQIEADIRTRLADGYVNNPQVAIGVSQFKSQRIFVVGEVRTPGVVPLTGTLTLVEALTRVGSLTENAGGDLVVIRPAPGRQADGPVMASDNGAKEVLRLDVGSLQARGPTSNLTLMDGDTVVVPRAEVFYINGQINSPGQFTYESNMTVLQAISKAGGVNDMGTTRRVKILRIVNGKRVELKAALSDRIQPGDTIQVATRWF